MSFNKLVLPDEKNFLKKRYKELGHKKFHKIYGRYDAYFCGNESNSYFVNEIIYKNKRYRPVIYEIKEFILTSIKNFIIKKTKS